MAKKRIIILGAGLAGLSAAWHLQKRGIECRVYEKESEVGGLCRSKKINGFIFDYDAHLLHFRNKYTLDLVRKFLKVKLNRHNRSSWVYSFGNFIRYPFQANLNALPPLVAKECLAGFLKAHRPKDNNVNFLQWINSYFGPGIARHFMVPYNEKFWTIPLDDLTCAWLNDFVPKPTRSQVIRGYYAGSKFRFGYNANFYYPQDGGIEKLSGAFENQISNVYKNCRVSSIDLRKKELVIAGKTIEKFDTLILTIPLPELVKIISPLPDNVLIMLRKLRWNSVFNLNLGLGGPLEKGKHWIYFPQKEISFFRVGFFHNFSGGLTPKGKGSLYAEVSYSKDKPINMKNIVLRVLKDLKANGIISKENQISVQDTNYIKYGYPIYDKYYHSARNGIINFLLTKSIIPCGRYGSWRYMSMEDVMLDGKEVADRVQ